MNHITLIGRLTKEPVISATSSGMTIGKYTLAVDRFGKDKGADFINCIAFDKAASFVEKYLHKGTKIAVEGRLQTGSYKNKEGQTVYTSDVIVTSHEFCESRGNESSTENKDANPFLAIPDAVDDMGLPF